MLTIGGPFRGSRALGHMQNIPREQEIMVKIKRKQGNIDLSRNQEEGSSLEYCSRSFVACLAQS